MHATFITSTGEAPGVNRVEVIGENGRLVLQGRKLTLWKNATPSSVFLRESTKWFDQPATDKTVVPLEEAPERARHYGGQHAQVLENFVDAILDGAPLIAPAADGLWALELANAIQLSAWRGCPVSLPLDDAAHSRAWTLAAEAEEPGQVG